jgi:hypothetical protein
MKEGRIESQGDVCSPATLCHATARLVKGMHLSCGEAACVRNQAAPKSFQSRRAPEGRTPAGRRRAREEEGARGDVDRRTRFCGHPSPWWHGMQLMERRRRMGWMDGWIDRLK